MLEDLEEDASCLDDGRSVKVSLQEKHQPIESKDAQELLDKTETKHRLIIGLHRISI